MVDRGAESKSGFGQRWHHRPRVPITVSPLFNWPLEPGRIIRWFGVRWVNLAENAILAVLAGACWLLWQPPLEEMRVIPLDWAAQIWVRNLVLMTVVAGRLHLYFYTFHRQGAALR